MTSRRIALVCMALAAAAGLAVIAADLPAAPSATPVDGAFAQAVRDTEERAEQHLTVTELSLRPRRFAYYTIGDTWKYTGPTGWAAGFHPGALWSCYQLTGERWWRDRAAAREASIIAAELSPDSLNLGALFFPSFVRGYRLTGDVALRDTALRAAAYMAQRYNPAVGAMLSRPGAEFNVIIDSLMKPQFLWWAAENGGPPEYVEIARRHALTTARDFVRADGSTCQIVYYDPVTGAMTRRGQGAAYSPDSTWARGQAWAILGFAAAYRETGDPELLAAARAVSDWYLANVPSDMVPYWDFQAPGIPLAPRDSSAAAIAASGLLDLGMVDPDAGHRERYETGARDTLAALMSTAYSSFEWNPAVVLHGTYSWHMGITDRGLAYGDAFFLEALLRLRRLAPDVPALPLARARASAGDAAAAIDRDLGTWWASRGKQTLDLRLAVAQEVGGVRVALCRGDTRAARLRIWVSSDGKHWRLARQTMTGGETAGFETLDFAPRTARWVRLQCSGTTAGSVNRIAEAKVYPAL